MSARRLALLLLCVAAPPARADAGGDYWSKVAHPHRERYLQLLAKGKQLLDTNDAANATPILREAVSLEPREPLGLWLLGGAVERQALWAECADVYGRIIKDHADWIPPEPREADPLETHLGICLSLAGRYEESVPHYQRVLAGKATGTQRGTVHWNLGDCYMVLGRLEEAIEQYALGVPDRPQESMLRFALGVAYDRDEQVARSREQIQAGLVIDNKVERIGDPSVYYLPPQDVFYYYGVVYQVASTSEGSGADPLRRAPAIAYFRRYLSSLPDGAWVARAREHLAELGPAVLQSKDVNTPADEPDRAPLVKAVLAAGPELQRCLEASPNVVVRVDIIPAYAKLKPAATPPPPPKPIAVGVAGRPKPNPYRPSTPPPASVPKASFKPLFSGPDEANPTIKACVEERLRALKLASTYPTWVSLSFTGR